MYQYVMSTNDAFNVNDCIVRHFHVDQDDRVAEREVDSPFRLYRLCDKNQACDEVTPQNNDNLFTVVNTSQGLCENEVPDIKDQESSQVVDNVGDKAKDDVQVNNEETSQASMEVVKSDNNKSPTRFEPECLEHIRPRVKDIQEQLKNSDLPEVIESDEDLEHKLKKGTHRPVTSEDQV